MYLFHLIVFLLKAIQCLQCQKTVKVPGQSRQDKFRQTQHQQQTDDKVSVTSGMLPLYESRGEKTGLWGFQPGLLQTSLYSHSSRLEA